MWIVIGFAVAVLFGVGAALVMARGEGHEHPTPWNVADLARLQASIMGTLGGVSITGIVLVVGLVANRANPAAFEINTVAIMFAIAFGYFVQTAYTLSYLPDRAVVGERLFRLYYSVANTLQFRTILLMGFALTGFGELYGLTATVTVLVFLMPFTIVGVFLVIAVVTDALGQMRFGECYLAAAIGLALGAAYWAVMRWLDADNAYAIISMALAFALVNGLTYVVAGLVPLTPRRPRLQAFMLRNARRFAAIDMQTTIISLIFLWLAVVGAV